MKIGLLLGMATLLWTRSEARLRTQMTPRNDNYGAFGQTQDKSLPSIERFLFHLGYMVGDSWQNAKNDVPNRKNRHDHDVSYRRNRRRAVQENDQLHEQRSMLVSGILPGGGIFRTIGPGSSTHSTTIIITKESQPPMTMTRTDSAEAQPKTAKPTSSLAPSPAPKPTMAPTVQSPPNGTSCSKFNGFVSGGGSCQGSDFCLWESGICRSWDSVAGVCAPIQGTGYCKCTGGRWQCGLDNCVPCQCDEIIVSPGLFCEHEKQKCLYTIENPNLNLTCTCNSSTWKCTPNSSPLSYLTNFVQTDCPQPIVLQGTNHPADGSPGSICTSTNACKNSAYSMTCVLGAEWLNDASVPGLCVDDGTIRISMISKSDYNLHVITPSNTEISGENACNATYGAQMTILSTPSHEPGIYLENFIAASAEIGTYTFYVKRNSPPILGTNPEYSIITAFGKTPGNYYGESTITNEITGEGRRFTLQYPYVLA